MKLTLDTKKLKKIKWNKLFYLLGGILFIFMATLIAVKFLFPIVLNLFKGIMVLYFQWQSLTDINFKFIGGIFFFIIGWKIFEALGVLWIKTVEWAIEGIQEAFKK